MGDELDRERVAARLAAERARAAQMKADAEHADRQAADAAKARFNRQVNIALAVVLAIGIPTLFWLSSEDERVKREIAAEIASRPQISDADCQRSISCWADRHQSDAFLACSDAVRQHARFEFRWSGGFLSPRFSEPRWGADAHTLMLSGRNAEFQNGFGAWQKANYACTYDPATKRAVALVDLL